MKRNGAPVARWWRGPPAWATWRSSAVVDDPSQVRTPSYFAWSLDGKQDSQAAAKVSGNDTIDSPTTTPPSWISTLPRLSCPTRPSAPPSSRCTTPSICPRPQRPQQQEDARRRARPGGGRHQRLHPPAPLCRPQGDRHALDSIHATGADGKADGPSLEPLIQFGWLTIIAKPLYLALRFMVARHRRRQLGLGHHHLHRHLQPAHAAHALHDDEVVAEDDAHPAQGGRHQEALRPSQDERPQAGRDEHRDDGALQDRGREHVRQLPAHAAADAALLRLLPRAAERGRAAPGALVLAHRSSRPTRCTFCPSSSSSPCSSRSTSRPRRAWTRPSAA